MYFPKFSRKEKSVQMKLLKHVLHQWFPTRVCRLELVHDKGFLVYDEITFFQYF